MKNVELYNELAPSYRASREQYRFAMRMALGPLAVYLGERDGPVKVLDVGSGAGLHTDAMVRSGFEVTAIDAEPEMLRVVQDNVPEAECIVADFWEFEPEETFDCVIAASFIHLFPKPMLGRVMARLASWLKPDGVIFLATVCGESFEGGWVEKEYNHARMKRWRVVYDESELLGMLRGLGFEPVYRWYDPDEMHEGKLWLDLIVRPRRLSEGRDASCGWCGEAAQLPYQDAQGVAVCGPCGRDAEKAGQVVHGVTGGVAALAASGGSKA